MPKIGELWAEIGARTEGLERGVARATGLLDQFGRPLQSVQGKTAQLDAVTHKASQSLGLFGRSSGAANTAVIAFGQGVQDIPYGLRGVINNVQFTAQSFTQLVASTGSARTAFASLGASFLGPAGILAAFSAVTVAVQLFSERTRDAKKEVDEFADSVSGLIGIADSPEKLEFSWQSLTAAINESEQRTRKYENTLADLQRKRRRPIDITTESIASFQLQRQAIDFQIKSITERIEKQKGITSELNTQRDTLNRQIEAYKLLSEVGGVRAKQEKEIADAIDRQARGLIATRPGITTSARVGFGAGEVRPVTTPRVGLLGQDIVGAPSLVGLRGLTDTFNALELSGARLGERLAATSDAAAGVEVVSMQVESQFKELARDTLKNFSYAIGEAVSGLVLFGDSLKQTVGNIGKRFLGQIFGSVINIGVNSALNAIPGVRELRAASALSQAAQRPAFDASGLTARISLNDLVIEQQRTATRNNLNLVGLS